jgi:hypothetical protein
MPNNKFDEFTAPWDFSKISNDINVIKTDQAITKYAAVLTRLICKFTSYILFSIYAYNGVVLKP